MGLDMWLNGKIYTNDVTLEKINLAKYNVKVDSINVELGYWRKANQIHGWFRRNLSDEVGNCNEVFIPHDTLIELYEVCFRTMIDIDNGNIEAAMERLPPEEGFYFGNYEIDEFYIQNVKHAIEILYNIFEMINNGIKMDVYYYAWW